MFFNIKSCDIMLTILVFDKRDDICMDIGIRYNDALDEFTYDLSLVMRLKNYISSHFYLAYTIFALAPIYLVGGSIRNLMFAERPKDMDFVVLGKEHLDWVLMVLQSYHIDFSLNRFGGYKFIYGDTEIDLWVTDDLFSSMQYNVDGLYFDLRTNSLFSLTFDDFDKNGLKLVNSENNIQNGREKKLIKFEKQYLDNKKIND